MDKTFEFLGKSELFSDFRVDQIGAVLDCLGFQRRALGKGLLLHSDDQLFYCGVVLEGVVDLILANPTGRNLIIRRLKAGDSFLVGTLQGANLVLEGVREAKLVLVNSASIFDCEKQHCNFRRAMMERLLKMQVAEMNHLYFKLAIYAERSLRQKILYFFEYYPTLPESYKTAIESNLLNRQALADYLGSDRSALSRELMKMEKDGLIRVDGRRIGLVK